MAASNEQTGLVILGSIFLGVWIFGMLWGFGFQNPTGWMVWGFVGFLLAGAAYGMRATEGAVRIVLLAGLGILSTVLFLSALAMEDPSVFGALCTALGAGLVAAALPDPRPTPPAPPATPPAAPATDNPATSAPAAPVGPEWERV